MDRNTNSDNFQEPNVILEIVKEVGVNLVITVITILLRKKMGGKL